MSILINKIRVKNFRALKDVEATLKPITLMVGANNAGKTTFLRALNTVLGVNRTFLNKDDLFIDKDGIQPEKTIIIDVQFVPTDADGNVTAQFDTQWSSIFGGESNISRTTGGTEFFAFRSEYSFLAEDIPEAKYFLIEDWENQTFIENFSRILKIRENIKMYFIDAQRDIEEDLRLRTSFFGKMATQITGDYAPEDIEELTRLISKLNETAVNKSKVLKHLCEALERLNQTTQTRGNGVGISPFSRNVRDLHKGMKVDFQDQGSDRFGMEYHGMGTRSWASILTAGAYVDWDLKTIEENISNAVVTNLLFPILAIEEPEAHLHPNAQRTLYEQLKDFKGQKIISTHSPYIAGQAELQELRHFYKGEDSAGVKEILFSTKEDDEIKTLLKEIEENGKTPDINRKNRPQIQILKEAAAGKISEDEARKIRKEIMQSKGDLLFAKALILFEGETELIALPVFAQQFFKPKNPYGLGINFVDVGGKENYKPFLFIAKFLNIPCFILSDNDGNTEKSVRNQIEEVYGKDTSFPLIVLDTGCDFEQYLLASGYKAEIVEAINRVEQNENYIKEVYIPELNGKKKKGGGERVYSGEDGDSIAILDCMHENKTKFAEDIAAFIVRKDHENVPPKLVELFSKVSTLLNIVNQSSNDGPSPIL